MKLTDRQLAHLLASLEGRVSLRSDRASNPFTAEEHLELIDMIKLEAKKRRSEIPPDWREQAAKFAEEKGIYQCPDPAEIARRKKIAAEKEARISRAKTEAMAQLPADALLKELGL